MADPAPMPAWLRQRARISPHKVALVFGTEVLTFAELDRRADTIAGRLREAGIKPRDHVALLANNSLAFAQVIFGASRAGAVLIPMNVRLTSSEIATQLQDSDAGLLISEADLLKKINRPSALNCLAIEDVTSTAHAPPLSLLGRGAGGEGEGLHSIIYTSGTTGQPKGAMLTYGNFLWNAVGSALNLGLREDDRWLACMPLFHVGGLSILLRGVIYGMTVEIHDGFDPERVNRALDGGEVTIVSLVATMVQRMLDRHEGGYHPNLRCVLLGGGPVPFELVQECLRRGIPVAQTYGLTEAASQVTTLLPSEAAAKPGSAGKPLMPVEMRVERDAGSVCDAGEAGEIVVRGPTMTPGYYKRPEATAVAIRDGWLHTGDFGYLDSDGYLYVVDRRDDVIVSGGENVYPAEVEGVLASHPAVREAGVFAVEHPEWGQQVVAAVSLYAEGSASAEELREHCRGRLAGFKVPKTIAFVAELPRNATGKLLRRELRRVAEEGLLK